MKKKRKKYIKIVVGVVAFILFIAVLGYGLQYVDNKTEKANVSDESSINDWKIQVPRGKIKLNGNKYEYYHDFENYLLIGTDATGNNNNGADYQGSMADFLMLVIVDKTENTYSFLQFNRDTMTEVALIDHNGEGEATANIQLCTAHWYGGNREQSCENTVKSVKKLLGGIQIDGYYELNMSEIPKLNNMVDGVTVTLEDDFSKKYPKMKKGATINLDDEQAYAYVHDRYGVGDEENTSRMKRQQQYMTGFFKKLQEKVKANPNYACDTLLLSVGLIPENELSREMGVELNRVTSGPVVNESLETNIEGVFACGNVLHVHDLVDFVSEEAAAAGKNAADYIKWQQPVEVPEQKQNRTIILESRNGVRYTVPAVIRPERMPEEMTVRFRVGAVYKNCYISCYFDEGRVLHKKRTILAPGEMEQIKLTKEQILNASSLRKISILIEEE